MKLAGIMIHFAMTAAILLLLLLLLLRHLCPAVQLPAAVLLGVSAAIDTLMGGRSSMLGLAGFVTLPSREVVSIWQSLMISLGTGKWTGWPRKGHHPGSAACRHAEMLAGTAKLQSSNMELGVLGDSVF